MASILNIPAHTFSNGSKVILKDFEYDDIELNGRFFYVKVIDSDNISLYTNSSLAATYLQDLTGVSLTANSQVVPVQYQATALYSLPGGFSFDGRGILNRNTQNITISTNTANYTLNTTTLSSYIPGITDVVLTVNAGVYLYSTAVATPAITIGAFAVTDTVKIINNGFIMGMGGDGPSAVTVGSPGGPAISLGNNILIENNSYIGGGGGSGSSNNYGGGGGGGAGGGYGGWSTGYNNPGQPGGGPGQLGTPGTRRNNIYGYGVSAGGGGRIMPGVGGYNPVGGGGTGAGAGGAGAYLHDNIYGGQGTGGVGGSGGGVGNAGNNTLSSGGGGGGYGAAGGSSAYGGAGGAGGKAVALNGYTVTYVTTGTIYGAVS